MGGSAPGSPSTSRISGGMTPCGADNAPGAATDVTAVVLFEAMMRLLSWPFPFQQPRLGGHVQMFSANSPHWLNGANNSMALTAQYTGVGNPLGLSNNNAFGRI